MDTLDTLKNRRCVRAYTDKMPSRELIEKVVEAGEYAPTGMGKQSPLMVVVTNKKLRDELSKLNAEVMGSDMDPFYGAPMLIVVLANRDIPTYLYDGSLVMGNMMNAAHAIGLAGCWIHRAKEVFDSPRGKELLKEWGIEGSYEGIGHLVLGYMNGELPVARPRKDNYVRYIE